MRDLTWKVLSSEYVHRGPWATLRRDVCALPDGRVKPEYFVLEYPNWCNAVAFTEEGKVVLVRQYRHAAKIISLELPGGVIEAGEDPAEAIKRELLEETGYQFDEVEQIAVVYANPSTGDNHTYCFIAKNGKKAGRQHLDDYEDIIVEEYTLAEVKQLLAENKIAQALHCTNLFYALIKLGELK
jgi:8-oxo-dGTP pyrophosphatase MutT (NUDIX family)